MQGATQCCTNGGTASSGYLPRLGWENLGGRIAAAPDCISWGPGRIDCFVRNVDNSMGYKYWNGKKWKPSPPGWEKITGILLSRPNCVTWGVGRIDCFVLGPNGDMYRIHSNAVSTSGVAEVVAEGLSDIE